MSAIQPNTSEVLWNLAQGITQDDLNNAQRFARTLALDGILGSQMQVELDSTTNFWALGADQVRVVGPGAASPQVSATARTVTNKAGLILQWTGSTGPVDVGSPTRLLAYFLSANELQKQLAVGDATNPRIDRICIKLDLVSDDQQSVDFETYALGPIVSGAQTYLRTVSSQLLYLKRATRCQVQVVAGTPAGSPTPPATPAGWAAWCDVLVPATHNAVFVALTHLRDWRLPSKLSIEQLNALQMAAISGFSTTSGFDRSATGAGQALVGLCNSPHYGRSRLVGTSFFSFSGLSTGTMKLQRLDHAANTYTDLLTLLTNPGPTIFYTDWTPGTFSASLPIWDTGYPISKDSMLTGDHEGYQLCARFTSGANGEGVRLMRWLLASPG